MRQSIHASEWSVASSLPLISTVQPQDAYGLEKLATEELCMHYNKDFSMECRIARFHNIYGPFGTWKGGREKAPAAFCRKVSRGRIVLDERASGP